MYDWYNIMTDTLYSELLWIARNAGLKDGWAWFRFKEVSATSPTKQELAYKPSIPAQSLISGAKNHMSEYRYNKLLRAYEWAKMPEEEKAKIVNERKQAKKFKARAFQALDAHRPKLENL